jgi:regulator of sigma E protease
LSIFVAILIFGIIILVHEIGHFYAARKVGILVEEFAIGMGPKVFSVTKGETMFSLRLFPLGGYCKMLGGDDDDSINDTRAFNNKTVGQRSFALSMGVVMNLVLAFILFTLLSLFFGYSSPEVTGFIPGTNAETSGLLPGDIITRIGSTRVNISDDLTFALSENSNGSIDVEARRGREIIRTAITPTPYDGRYLLGVTLKGNGGLLNDAAPMGSIFGYLAHGFWQISFWVKLMVTGIVQLFTFNLSPDNIGGPIMLVAAISEGYTATMAEGVSVGIRWLVRIAAIISANLGVMNLLPLPALDGGRLIFLGIEKIRRKPVPPEREGLVHLIGFAALICFAVFIAFKDIQRLI